MNQNQIIHLQVHVRLALVTVKSLTSLRSCQSVLGQSEGLFAMLKPVVRCVVDVDRVSPCPAIDKCKRGNGVLSRI